MNLFIVWFHKVSILPPPHRRSFEIPRGRGVLKAKLLQEKYEAKLEFPGGERGIKQHHKKKKPSMEGVWIFSGTLYHVLSIILSKHACLNQTTITN